MIDRYEASVTGVKKARASPPPSIQSIYKETELPKYVDSLKCHDEPGADYDVRLT